MANNEEYRDYDDAYSAGSENTNTSVKSAKRNRVLLDNNMNWYVFENSILMGLDYLDRYRNTIFNMVTRVRIGSDYYMRPEYVSYELYGTTDYWYLLLWLNNMKNPNEFVKSEIYIVAKNRIGDLQKVLDQARNYVYNVYNPKPVQKHYMKHPKLPSVNLLPDSYNEKIYDCGFVTYEKFNFLNSLEYIHNPNEYYHGKSKMAEIKENIFTKSYKELSLKYMDGIQISNTTYDPIFDNTGDVREYKFTGYMYFPNSGIYDFQFNGINGSAYLIVGNDYCTNDKGEKNIKLPEVDKKFDFFELKTRNSDFKKRNWDGWTGHHKNLRLLTDPIKRKPVAKINIDDNYFLDDNIITTSNDYIIDNDYTKCKNCNELRFEGEEIYCSDHPNFIVCKSDKRLFYNIMTADELNIDLEPYNNGNDGKIIFTCDIMAHNVNNVEIQPYIKINYTDGTNDTSILSHYNIGTLWNTNEYETLIVSINKDKDKRITTIEFGIICDKVDTYDKCSASISINQVSINLTEFDIVSCTINENNKGKWLPFVCSYKYNGNIMKMFYIKRRVRLRINNGHYIIDKENNIICTLDNKDKLIYKFEPVTDEYVFRRNWLKILRNQENSNGDNTLEDILQIKNGPVISLKVNDFDLNDDGTFYLISPYEYVNRDQIAIVPLAGENLFNESVLVTISDPYDREACFLQHNINKEVIIYSDEPSNISFKTCLVVENNNSSYKFELENEEEFEIYLDGVKIVDTKGVKKKFDSFCPTDNNLNDLEIENRGYRLANLEIYIKNTNNKTIRASVSIKKQNEFQKLSDDYFVVKPQQLFPLSAVNTKNNKRDVILIDDGKLTKQLSVFKPGIITLEEEVVTRECNNYVLEFDINVNSDQNGLFVINLDSQSDGKKYSLLFNYKTSYNENPIFDLLNGLYTNTSNTMKDISNIDRGIDFYKHKYEEVPIYKNMIPLNENNSLKKFELSKNVDYHIKIKKKKHFISLQIDNRYVAIWHDYDKAYADGLCGFTFINLNNVVISNLSLKC